MIIIHLSYNVLPISNCIFSMTMTGKRLRGGRGSDHDMDSPGFLLICNWFLLRVQNWSDHDPTSGRVEVDKMSLTDFYTIFVLDMLDLESIPLSDVPRMSVFMSVWQKEYPNVVIRKVKTVDSKDKVGLRYTTSQWL